MNKRRISRLCLAAALAVIVASFGLNVASGAPPRPADNEQGIEVLTRGPVHEAFAETISFDPEPGVVAPKPPPEAIEELPPDQRPDGNNVAWIPGYFAWDDERNDFLWVSGIWRDLPPGREWVSGYWAQSGKGSQWTSGYWADAESSEVEYLTEPPQSIEEGPSVAATDPNQTWLPGSWVWQQNRYAWRPGFWATVQPNWVWVPDHYRWAPRGYVYVDGYWDYALDRRGVLFAPAFFNVNLYSRPGFSYSPSMVINLNAFTDHLFVRSGYGHYYFGDYYDSNYSNSGFYPWFSYQQHRGYDPIFAHDRWRNRNDRGWEKRVVADFGRRRDDEGSRPSRSLATLNAPSKSDGKPTGTNRAVVQSYDQFTKSKDNKRRFQAVDKNEREQIGKRDQDLRAVRDERQKREIQPAETKVEKIPTNVAPNKVKRTRSPIMGKPASQFSKEQAPPQRHRTPNPDLKVEPRPRRPASYSATSQDQPNVTTPRAGPDRPKRNPDVAKPGPKPENPMPKSEPKEKLKQ